MRSEPGSIEDGLKRCHVAFEGRLAILSNSAGLRQFDPEGTEAETIERALGIPVLRHDKKKPDGEKEELEKYFGCEVEKLIMIGDRILTDVVYGNRLGMFTIMPEPITGVGEPMTVKWSRALERKLEKRYRRKGILPPPHCLVSNPRVLESFLLS